MNVPVRRGPVATFFVGVWNVVNFARKLFLNVLFFGFLLFLVMFLIILGGMKSSVAAAPLIDRTTLVIAPEGRLVEQYSADPATRALAKLLNDKDGEEVQLRDMVRAIDAARADKRIERIWLRLDDLQPTGYASTREVAAALARFRASGKQIVASGEGFGQGQYLLAAQANEIYVDPMAGGVELLGLSSHSPYLGQALQEKLEVDVNVFKVGEYKSAVEHYILNGASPEAKEADLFWMNDVWQRYLADIAKARRITAEQIAAGIDTMPEGIAAVGGDLARFALQQKLVDGLKTREEVENLLAERGVADSDAESGFRSMNLDAYLTHLDAQRPAALDGRPQIAVVVAEGGISGGEQPGGQIGGESTSALLREARDDSDVKAVVLRVNSPGGEVFASEQIRREVEALKKAGKPVVVSMGDLAASGGYWISMNADRIYADPSTITGSIGIFGVVPTFQRTLEKIGVHTDGVGTTRFAGAFNRTRELDPEVGRIIQSVINKGYADFTGRVAAARKKPVEAIDAVARGRVWSGAQALERGLVDELGGMQAALDDAARRAKLGGSDKYRVRYIEQMASPFAQFMGRMAGTRIGALWLKDSDIARAMLAQRLPQTAAQLRFLDQAAQDRNGTPVKAVAYCFCGF